MYYNNSNIDFWTGNLTNIVLLLTTIDCVAKTGKTVKRQPQPLTEPSLVNLQRSSSPKTKTNGSQIKIWNNLIFNTCSSTESYGNALRLIIPLTSSRVITNFAHLYHYVLLSKCLSVNTDISTINLLILFEFYVTSFKIISSNLTINKDFLWPICRISTRPRGHDSARTIRYSQRVIAPFCWTTLFEHHS